MIKNTKKMLLSTIFLTIYFLLVILISAYIRMNVHEFPGLGIFGVGSVIGYLLLSKWSKKESVLIQLVQLFIIFFSMYIITSILNYFGLL